MGIANFGVEGFYVHTVGRNQKRIEAYIRNQLQEDVIADQLSLFEEYDLGKLLLHEFQCLFFHIIIGRFDQYLLCISHRLFDVYILGRIQYDTYNSMQYVLNYYSISSRILL